MIQLKLKDDYISWILPRYEEKYAYDDDSITPTRYLGSIFSVDVGFERSTDFRYECNSCYVDECAVSEVIKYLISNASKFETFTAEEFKDILEEDLYNMTH